MRPTGKVLGKAGGIMVRSKRDLRAGWRRKRPTALPKQSGLLRLRPRGNDTVQRRAACDGSCGRRLRNSARWRSRANRSRRRRTASPEQPGLLRLSTRGNDAVQRRTTCNSSYRTRQRSGAWIMRDVRMVRIVEFIKLGKGHYRT
jgi:hypothetical protein